MTRAMIDVLQSKFDTRTLTNSHEGKKLNEVLSYTLEENRLSIFQ